MDELLADLQRGCPIGAFETAAIGRGIRNHRCTVEGSLDGGRCHRGVLGQQLGHLEMAEAAILVKLL